MYNFGLSESNRVKERTVLEGKTHLAIELHETDLEIWGHSIG